MYNRPGPNPPKKLSCMNSATMRRERVHSAWPGCDNVAEFGGRGRHEARRMPGHARNPRRRAPIPVAAGSRYRERRGQRPYGVPAMNGFRRFWNKARKNSFSRDPLLPSLIKEHMAGHTGVATPDRHCKARVREPAAECMRSVPALIIVDSERLRLENARQARRIGKMQDERDIETAAPKRIIEEMAKIMEGARPVGGMLRRRSRASDRHAKSKREAADA